MASQRISEETREAVVEAMRARRLGKPTVAAIAAQFGIGSRTVQRIANKADVVPEAARAQTQNATAQVRATNAELRADLSKRLLAAANAALDDIDNGSVVTGMSWGEVVCKRVGHITARDRQALLTGAAIALDKHKMLDAYDGASDNADVAAYLEWMRSAPGAAGRG